MENKVPMMKTSRQEVDGELHLVEGQAPADLHGVFYVSYPVGTVNSDGLPIRPTFEDGTPNPEYGSPLMSGDGMVLKLDLAEPGNPKFKTRLMKTPCWWADFHSRRGTPDEGFWGFRNFGISRISPTLGARNLLNTAISPVRFPGSETTFLLATYDVGRPFLLDADSLELVSPLGKTRDWQDAQPAFLPWPFGIEQTTAHPQFDPHTQEWFSVSYHRAATSFVLRPATLGALSQGTSTLRSELSDLAVQWHGQRTTHGWLDQVHELFQRHDSALGHTAEAHAPVDLQLIRWKGDQTLEKWTVVDQDGLRLDITECMHQTGMTRDWLILTDCSFKFKLDLLVNNPFPDDPLIDEFLRHLLSGPMTPYTKTYLIRRADLVPGGGLVRASELEESIPLETIHYNCEFENPDDVITLYAIHNAAECVAEWIRPFDRNQLTGKPVDPDYVSLFALGNMDVSRIGKWKIDAKRAKIVDSSLYYDPGVRGSRTVPHTWGAAFHTFRDMLSADNTAATVDHLWVFSSGNDEHMLTEFIFHLYQDYPHRLCPVEDVLEVTRENLPFSLVHLTTHNMKAVDHYNFPRDVFLRGVQFVPRAVPTPGVDAQLDGYLLCPVHAINQPGNPDLGFHSEFWLFDPTSLQQGPLCRWASADLVFAFTLHTAWIPAARPYTGTYRIDAIGDYHDTIDALPLDLDKTALHDFFRRNVDPYWNSRGVDL